MNCNGTYKFHSMMSIDEDNNRIYLSGDDYINMPMPEDYGEREISRELNERKMMALSEIVIEDDNMYVLSPIPEEASKEEVEKAVKAGVIELKDGKLLTDRFDLKEEDGIVYYDTRIEGEVLGEKVGSWEKLFDEDGFLKMICVRYEKK